MLNQREQDFLKALDQPLFNDETGSIYEDRIDSLYQHAEFMVNCFGFNLKELASVVQGDVLRRCIIRYIALEWIHYHAEKGYYDGRNEAAMKMIKKIYGMEIYQKEYHFCFDDARYGANFETVAKLFVEKSQNMHRTLMQTFTSFILCFLSLNMPVLHEEMIDSYGDSWYRLPLI